MTTIELLRAFSKWDEVTPNDIELIEKVLGRFDFLTRCFILYNLFSLLQECEEAHPHLKSLFDKYKKEAKAMLEISRSLAMVEPFGGEPPGKRGYVGNQVKKISTNSRKNFPPL